MNCQEFESRVETLARGALADARHVSEASAHEESCAACAALLADERALSTGLRALATGMKGVEAPARAESALLAAFRARAAEAGAKDLNGAASNVVPLAPHASARSWSWAKTAAVASLAAAASLALFVLVRPEAGGGQRAMIEPPPGAIGGQKPRPEVARVVQPVVETNANSSTTEEVTSPAPAGPKERPERAQLARGARAVNASYGGDSRAASARSAADARPQEIATEFIPLTQSRPYAQSEEGHLVRVELPRSALASFGLPVGAESAGGRVKADVLLGEDGTARAIRFIR